VFKNPETSEGNGLSIGHTYVELRVFAGNGTALGMGLGVKCCVDKHTLHTPPYKDLK
jgi:hypothetical protein